MSDKYEWEVAEDDNKKTRNTIVTLILGATGLIFKHLSDQNKKQIQDQLNRKIDRYRELDGKLFRTSKEKAEMEELAREINGFKA